MRASLNFGIMANGMLRTYVQSDGLSGQNGQNYQQRGSRNILPPNDLQLSTTTKRRAYVLKKRVSNVADKTFPSIWI
jgi:hypothetical protein